MDRFSHIFLYAIKLIKKYCIEILLFVSLVGFIFPIKVSTDLTSSGYIYIYIPDFTLSVMVLIVTIDILKNRKQLSIKGLVCAFFWCIIAYSVILAVLRYLCGISFYKGLVNAVRVTMPICAYGIIFDKKRINSLIISINLSLSSIYAIVIVINTVYNSIATDFMMNRNIVAYVCICGLVFGIILLYMENKPIYTICVGFNTVFCIAYCFLCGSRSGLYVAIFALIAILLITWSKRVITIYVPSAIIACVIICVMLATNTWDVKWLWGRGFNLSTVTDSIKLEKEVNQQEGNNHNPTIPNELVLTEEKVLSGELSSDDILTINDAGRFFAWKEGVKCVLKSPFLGSGDLGVYVFEGQKQGPHNFILEYLLLFGAIGFVIMVVLVLIMIFSTMKYGYMKDRVLALLTLVIVFGIPFLQPILVTSIGPSIAWLLIYSLRARQLQDVSHSK